MRKQYTKTEKKYHNSPLKERANKEWSTAFTRKKLSMVPTLRSKLDTFVYPKSIRSRKPSIENVKTSKKNLMLKRRSSVKTLNKSVTIKDVSIENLSEKTKENAAGRITRAMRKSLYESIRSF